LTVNPSRFRFETPLKSYSYVRLKPLKHLKTTTTRAGDQVRVCTHVDRISKSELLLFSYKILTEGENYSAETDKGYVKNRQEGGKFQRIVLSEYKVSDKEIAAHTGPISARRIGAVMVGDFKEGQE
jgi:hypothetical protein